MNKEQLTEQFANAIKEMNTNHFEGTYYWLLDTNSNGNNWAIVLAFMDYDGEGKEQLYAKLAYQPSNSLMGDYDIDWLMPYDENTGEVFDNEISIGSETDAQYAIEWLLKCYEEYKEDGII